MGRGTNRGILLGKQKVLNIKRPPVFFLPNGEKISFGDSVDRINSLSEFYPETPGEITGLNLILSSAGIKESYKDFVSLLKEGGADRRQTEQLVRIASGLDVFHRISEEFIPTHWSGTELKSVVGYQFCDKHLFGFFKTSSIENQNLNETAQNYAASNSVTPEHKNWLLENNSLNSMNLFSNYIENQDSQNLYEEMIQTLFDSQVMTWKNNNINSNNKRLSDFILFEDFVYKNTRSSFRLIYDFIESIRPKQV